MRVSDRIIIDDGFELLAQGLGIIDIREHGGEVVSFLWVHMGVVDMPINNAIIWNAQVRRKDDRGAASDERA